MPPIRLYREWGRCDGMSSRLAGDADDAGSRRAAVRDAITIPLPDIPIPIRRLTVTRRRPAQPHRPRWRRACIRRAGHRGAAYPQGAYRRVRIRWARRRRADYRRNRAASLETNLSSARCSGPKMHRDTQRAAQHAGAIRPDRREPYRCRDQRRNSRVARSPPASAERRPAALSAGINSPSANPDLTRRAPNGKAGRFGRPPNCGRRPGAGEQSGHFCNRTTAVEIELRGCASG